MATKTTTTIQEEVIDLRKTPTLTPELDTIQSFQKELPQTYNSPDDDLWENQPKPSLCDEPKLLVNETKDSLSLSEIRSLADENDLTDNFLIKELKKIIDEAVMYDKEWNVVEDFWTRLRAIQTWLKMKWLMWKPPKKILNIFNSGNTNIR